MVFSKKINKTYQNIRKCCKELTDIWTITLKPIKIKSPSKTLILHCSVFAEKNYSIPNSLKCIKSCVKGGNPIPSQQQITNKSTASSIPPRANNKRIISQKFHHIMVKLLIIWIFLRHGIGSHCIRKTDDGNADYESNSCRLMCCLVALLPLCGFTERLWRNGISCINMIIIIYDAFISDIIYLIWNKEWEKKKILCNFQFKIIKP